MKTAAVLTALILTAATHASAATTKTLECREPQSFASVVAELDDSGYDPGSGYVDVVTASLGYQYSSVGRMACEGTNHNGVFDTNCVGYYAGIREITELKIRTEGSQIVAYWETSKSYGHKKMRTICTLKSVN